MKGLFLHNMYSVSSALFYSLATGLFFTLILLAIVLFAHNTSDYIGYILLIQIGSFAGMSGTALEKERASRWSSFQLSLPVTSKEIVQARYLSFLCFAMIGIALMSGSALLIGVVAQDISLLSNLGFAFEFGVFFALVVPAILYPFILRFGADKTTVFLLLAVLVSVVIYFSVSLILKTLFQSAANLELVTMVGVWISSITLFYASYRYSIHVQKKMRY
ncbi:MAG: ABC-2 transporter permease [Erysipelotrichaceae bacterium]